MLWKTYQIYFKFPSPELELQWGRSSWQSPRVCRYPGSEFPEDGTFKFCSKIKRMNAECGWRKRQRHGMWVNKYLKVLKCWSNTWKALSSSLSWADVKVVRILRCFLFSVKTPSWPGYILYGRPAGENIMLLHSAIDLYLEREQRKQRPLYISPPLPLLQKWWESLGAAGRKKLWGQFAPIVRDPDFLLESFTKFS